MRNFVRDVRATLSQSTLVQTARDIPLRVFPPESFSQHGEDVFIFKELFKGSNKPGLYVDIGASHPARLSNTYFFYRMGWSGLTVEPILWLHRLHRSWRPRDTQLQCLIGERDQDIDFYQLYPSVLSTTSEAFMREQTSSGAVLLKKQAMPARRLSTLLEVLGERAEIDLMSVDVEGVDELIALQISELDDAALPRILCIEAQDGAAEAAIVGAVGARFTNQKKLGCNLIFWR